MNQLKKMKLAYMAFNLLLILILTPLFEGDTMYGIIIIVWMLYQTATDYIYRDRIMESINTMCGIIIIVWMLYQTATDYIHRDRIMELI